MTTSSETAEIAASLRHLRATFDWTYPVVGILSLFYIGFGDVVFRVFDVVGRRLPKTLRSLLREAYCAVEVLVAGALHTCMFSTCFTADACHDRPLHRRWCMFTSSVCIVAYVIALVVARGAEPLLKIPESYPGPARGRTARVFNASAVCTAWICLADGETMGVVLLLAVTARRALALVPSVATLYIRLLKTYVLAYTFWVLHDPATCHAASRRAPVAVMGTILSV